MVWIWIFSVFGTIQPAQPVNLAFEYRGRTRAAKSFWDIENGKRGSNLGGAAYRISGAFSANNGSTRPYLSVDWIAETRRSAKVTVENETRELQIRPGSQLWLKSGLEIPFKQVDTTETVEGYIEGTMGFGYRSWREVPSGIFLPDVLPESNGISVTQTAALLGSGGLYLGVRVPQFFQWRTGVEVLYETPHFVEDVYNVKTGRDSYTLQFHTQLSGTVNARLLVLLSNVQQVLVRLSL